METSVTTIISLIISAISALGIGGVITTLIKIKLEDKRKQSEESKQKRKAEKQAEMREVMQAELEPIKKEVSDVHKHLDKIGQGTLSSLRNDILTCYYRCNEKGYRNDYDYTNIHDLYDAYKALDGNSFVADIMTRFDNLKTKEEYKKEQSRINKKLKALENETKIKNK